MDILERLKLKAAFYDRVRMPSIKQISKLLDEYGKTGLCLTIKDPYLQLDTSDSYCSLNTPSYARTLLGIIEKKTQ